MRNPVEAASLVAGYGVRKSAVAMSRRRGAEGEEAAVVYRERQEGALRGPGEIGELRGDTLGKNPLKIRILDCIRIIFLLLSMQAWIV